MHGPCNHGWAAVIFQAAERLDAEELTPTVIAFVELVAPLRYECLASTGC